jgi:hypothetical protein
MIRDWTVTRRAPNGEVVLGTLATSGGSTCFTLERLAVLIPEGRYRVTLTPSARAEAGTLWAPAEDHLLPLLMDVPDRTAVRLHAGNHIMDTDGCLLVGSEHDATEIQHSRPALTKLVQDLHDAAREGDEVWVTIV